MSGDITKLDVNFKQAQAEILGDDKIYTLPCSDIDLYGGHYDYDLNQFQRMDADAAKSVSYGVEVLSTTTAGMRARFKTNSKKIGISVSYNYLAKMTHMPLTGSSGFSLLEKTQEGFYHVATFRPNYDDSLSFSAQVGRPGEMSEYILFFPLYNDFIKEIKLIFDADSVVENASKYAYDLPILYYGSSITQGGCCSRPDNCYQAYISKWNDIDFINLGFSGGAKGEDQIIDYLATVKSKIFVMDYDHNAPNPKHLKDTHSKMYSAYRKANPQTPIIMITKPDFDRNVQDALKRFKVIKRTYLNAKASGDENVYFIDGKKLFGKQDRENCTVDGTHPNDLGFYRMAIEIDKVIKKILAK